MPTENLKEWVWDNEGTTDATLLRHGNEEVCFHPNYSSGTAAVRGNKPCIAGQDYFWEIEMLTSLYGTDVMVGVGTKKANLKKYQFKFGSLLGSDGESWGYSYHGNLHHNGIYRQYDSSFTHGNVVGVHLDMWNGTLTFYIDRKPLGVAYTSLKGHTLYPMVCSTAARCAMRIVCSYSFPSSLQLHCLKTLGLKPDLVEKVHSIPGFSIYAEKAFWHLFPSSCSDVVRDHKINNLLYDSEDSDVEDRQIFSRAVFTGEFHQPHPDRDYRKRINASDKRNRK